MFRGVLTGLLLSAGFAFGTAQADTTTEFERTDYSDPATWLCHPKKSTDACDIDLTATAIEADGTTRLINFTPAEDPAFDCFYIYPTVSFDPTPNSDLDPGPEELNVIANQLARYGATCRLFAPMYRQRTLLELRTQLMTGEATSNQDMRYADIIDSWTHYLETENDGRGVLLIGHSQGADMLSDLLSRDLAGSEVMDQVIAVHAIGFPVFTADGETSTGIPICRSADQTGCMVAYASFNAAAEPPAESRFGMSTPLGRSVCTNPAALTGDDTLEAYMPTRSVAQLREINYGADVDTDFVALPGFVKAECRSNETHDWLAIMPSDDPDDVRTGKLGGEVVVNGNIVPSWGLHLIDMNVAMGTLVRLAESQGEAWLAKQAD